jgi:hypothetical protein
MLQQLAQRRPHLSNEIQSLYDTHILHRTRPNVGEITKALQAEIQGLSKLFVVVDALDECSQSDDKRDQFLGELQKLTIAQVLITSRPHISNIPEYFDDVSSLEILATDDDIKVYIKERISKQNRLKLFVQEEPALRDAIINGIIKNVRGM